MQQQWGPAIQSMDQVTPECQENFTAIIKRALALGINHFETARAYGCSELQYGVALKAVLDEGVYKREDMIIQTKVPATKDPAKFRELCEKSFGLMLPSIGHCDLFAFHGINRDDQLEWITKPGGCMEIALEYQKEGKIKNIGFSTHGMPQCIEKCIETDKFDCEWLARARSPRRSFPTPVDPPPAVPGAPQMSTSTSTFSATTTQRAVPTARAGRATSGASRLRTRATWASSSSPLPVPVINIFGSRVAGAERPKLFHRLSDAMCPRAPP